MWYAVAMTEETAIDIDAQWTDAAGNVRDRSTGRIVRAGAGNLFTPETSARARQKKRERREVGAQAAQAALVAGVQWWMDEAKAGRVPGDLGDLLRGAGDRAGAAQGAPLTVQEAAEVVLATLVPLALGWKTSAKDQLAAQRLLFGSGMLTGDTQEPAEAAGGAQPVHSLHLHGPAADRVAGLLAARLAGGLAAGGPGGVEPAEEARHRDTMVVPDGLGGGAPCSPVSGPHPADPPAPGDLGFLGVLEGRFRETQEPGAQAPPEAPAAAGGPGVPEVPAPQAAGETGAGQDGWEDARAAGDEEW
jgi:hypothetical protein